MDDQVFEALVEEYYLESIERLQTIEATLLEVEQVEVKDHAELLVAAKRELHTLKGNSGMMGLSELQSLAHEVEDRVVELTPGDDLSAILSGSNSRATVRHHQLSCISIISGSPIWTLRAIQRRSIMQAVVSPPISSSVEKTTPISALPAVAMRT